MAKMNRILSLVLAAAMLLSMASIGRPAAQAAEDADMPALVPDVPADAVISADKQMAYFTFTPEQTGVYMFSADSTEDTRGYLYDENMNELTSDDDSGEDLNFLVSYELVAGATYIFGARYYDSSLSGSFTVLLTKSPVVKVEAEPLSIVEGTCGVKEYIWDGDGEVVGEYHYYYWQDYVRYTVTFDDGTVLEASGSSFEYNGIWYSPTYQSEQNGYNPWTAGNTYTAQLTVMGVTTDVPVTITASPVESITVEPLAVMEGVDGDWQSEYNSETDDYDIWWYRYNWGSKLRYTITFTDGSTLEASGVEFEYNGEWHNVSVSDDQSSQNPWEPGNSYDVSVTIMGKQVQLTVEITESPVSGVTVEPISLVEGTNGYWTTEDDDGVVSTYYHYMWWEHLNYEITFKDGSTIQGNSQSFTYNGEEYYITANDPQCGAVQWTVGNTYTVPVSAMGVQTELCVTIEDAPIADITFHPVTVTAGCDGFLNTAWNPETGEDDLQYFHYVWGNKLCYTVTFTDGTTLDVTGGGFDYDGVYYSVDYTDEQTYNTPWLAGGTYDGTVLCLGEMVTVPVTVQASPVSGIVFDPLALTEGTGGYYTNDWNEAEGEWNLEYFVYEWDRNMTYTITFTDGTVVQGQGRTYEYNGETYSLDWDDGQGYDNQWQGGMTYLIAVSTMGISGEIAITIDPSPVASIVFDPIFMEEGVDCTLYNQWNPETESNDLTYYHYEWKNYLSYTVTFTDGTVMKAQGMGFEYDGVTYSLNCEDGQNYNNQWQAGETYTVTIDGAGIKTDVSVTIQPTTIASIVFEPITVIKDFDGSFEHEWNEQPQEDGREYFRYYWWNKLRYTVTYTDGTTQDVEGLAFIHNGKEVQLDWLDSQSADSPWEVGNTYTVTAILGGKEFEVQVTVTATPVVSVEVSPIEIFCGTNGYLATEYIDETESAEYYRYDWSELLELTITYADGTVCQESGTHFQYNGKWYSLEYSDDQSYQTPWTQGNTYSGTINIMGYGVQVPVTILTSPVASITVEPVSIIERTHGYYTNFWNPETEEYDLQVYCYQWWNELRYTVTYADGSSYSGRGLEFPYEGEWYRFELVDGQSGENEWGVGTHTAKVSAMGATASVSVTITESPIQSIILEPITVQKGVDDYWNYSQEYRRRYYQWFEKLNGTVNFADGTVAKLTSLSLSYQGEDYYGEYEDSQSKEFLWEVGGEYTVSITLMGVTVETTVTVIDTDVQSVEMKPIVMAENCEGYWCTYHDDDTEIRYYCYDWWNSMEYTVTFKDGTTVTGIGPDFMYNEEWYSVTSFDYQQHDNLLTAGNTYIMNVDVAGYETEVTVQIVIPESDSGFEYLILDGKAYIVGCTRTDAVLNVPASVDGYEVAGIRSLGEALATVEELVIPDTVTELSRDLFYETETNVRKVTLGSGVTSLEASTFTWVQSLEEIDVSEDNPAYSSVDGVLYNKNVTVMVAFPRAHRDTHVIPDSVTDVSLIFEDLAEFAGIAIQTGAGTPQYVTVDEVIYTADMKTVLLCSGAKTGSYVMPESVTTIKTSAFAYCALTVVTVSPNVKELPYLMFYECSNLETVVLSEGLEIIGNCAFISCNALESVTIPASVRSVGGAAFAWCEALRSVIFLGDAPEFHDEVFYGISLKCYYPANNPTWTDEVLLSCPGEVEWIPYGADMTAPTLAGKSFSLSFEDEILVNFYYSVSDMSYVTEHGMLVFYTKPETPDYSNADDVYTDGDFNPETGLSMAQTHGIAAKYMGDTRYYVAYAKLMDGTVVYSKAYEYSPKKYAMNMLSRASTSDKQKALCVAMLNYGAAAQEFFGYNTDALMNADLTDAQKAMVDPYDAALFTGAISADSNKTANFPKTLMGFSQRSASVSFEGAFAINYYFAPNEEVAGEMTFYYWTPADYAAADELSADNASGSFGMKRNADGSCWAQVSGIAAKNLDKTYYVCGKYTDTLGRTFCTGVIAYSLSKYCMNNAVEGKEMQHLAAATAMYGYYAAQYFNT